MSTLKNKIGQAMLVAAFVAGWATLVGCDETGMAGFGGYGGGGYYPDWGLYDPTQDIQDVIDYRWDVMDWSNDGWDDYIRE